MRCTVKVSTRGFMNDFGHLSVWSSRVTVPKQMSDDRMALHPAGPSNTRRRCACAGRFSSHSHAAAAAIRMH